ncbi:MAG: hypothetical protein KDC87_07440 [Planctomycetes bacterium]|nr:hypothetical protein [Planctomycetota bacterium]
MRAAASTGARNGSFDRRLDRSGLRRAPSGRRRAPGQARAGTDLQATALVRDAFLRLRGRRPDGYRDEQSFFGAVAMRDLLVERCRHEAALKHGGGRQREPSSLIANIGADGAPTGLRRNRTPAATQVHVGNAAHPPYAPCRGVTGPR